MSSLVDVQGMTKVFGTQKAVDNVSFSLENGVCVGLIGENGAGKTTALRMLAGLMKPTSGKIRIAGLTASDDFRHLIGYLPQHPAFFSWMTGEEFLTFSGRLADVAADVLPMRVTELLEKLKIADARKKRIGKYSGGMKQRLGIAQSLIHSPRLLLLDEPVSALDPMGRRDVLKLIQSLKQDVTILFSTHILKDAEELCDEVLFMHRGQIVESGSLTELQAKNAESQFVLELSNGFESAREKLSAAGFKVLETPASARTISVEVDDEAKDRQALFELFAKEQWPVRSFALKEATLEDLFMKVVGTK